MKLASYQRAMRDSAERFAKDIGPHEHDEYLPSGHLGPLHRVTYRAHEMKIRHDDGLYRHLKFRSPDHTTYWFDLITVPGSLFFRGDGESFAFSRVEDMFAFFRDSSGHDGIDPGYWSEKLTSSREAAFKYDEESFREQLWECVRQYGGKFRGLAKEVQAHFFDDWASEYDVSFEDQARAALESFSYTPNDWTQPFTFTDTWEWDLKGYDWWFLWACRAIVWGIRQYDAVKAPAPAQRAVATVATAAV